MDNILRPQPDSHRFSDGNVHYTDADDIILSNRIVAVKTDVVRRSDEFRIRPAKLAIGTRIVEIPKELFACDLDDRRILRLVCEINRRPNALAHKNENGEDHGSGDQENRFDLRIVVPVGRSLVTVGTVSGDE